MRRVKVNAQVTFVIYILEWVANFSIAVTWFFVSKQTSDITLTLSVLWYHVFLPYIFLMNTSHNKQIVIDEGWWNIFRNALGLPSNIIGEISNSQDMNHPNQN